MEDQSGVQPRSWRGVRIELGFTSAIESVLRYLLLTCIKYDFVSNCLHHYRSHTVILWRVSLVFPDGIK